MNVFGCRTLICSRIALSTPKTESRYQVILLQQFLVDYSSIHNNQLFSNVLLHQKTVGMRNFEADFNSLSIKDKKSFWLFIHFCTFLVKPHDVPIGGGGGGYGYLPIEAVLRTLNQVDLLRCLYCLFSPHTLMV